MRYLLALFGLFLLASCATAHQKKFDKNIGRMVAQRSWEQQFTGIFIYDPEAKDTLYSLNSEKYFTPASNTKIFTLFAAMELLPELLPQLQYQVVDDTLYIRGTGDPTLLHPFFRASKSLDLLKREKHITWVTSRLQAASQGPGWSWGDYDAYYAPERSELPLYGNVLLAGRHAADSTWTVPGGFTTEWKETRPEFARARHQNHFYLHTESPDDTLEIPYITDTTTTLKLLGDYLNTPVSTTELAPTGTWETLYGIPADSVYKRMMKVSDNFLAEQLLIQASGMIGDTLDPERTINFMLEGALADLAHQPRWVDGSGLSRYNLFTPQSMVHVLDKLYQCYGTERLFKFFPEGGVSGTLKNYFPGNSEPYIHAKTGTLSNNYCLSGYLVTRSGKTLIFSFMNNHYMGSSIPLKRKMTPLLEWVRDNY